MIEFRLLLLSVFRGTVRDHRALLLENLLVRHQLAVPLRSRPRPKLRARGTLFWVLARRRCADGRWHRLLVRLETVVRWHRRGWRLV